MEMFWRTKGKRIAAWLMIALIMATTIPFGSIRASADDTTTDESDAVTITGQVMVPGNDDENTDTNNGTPYAGAKVTVTYPQSGSTPVTNEATTTDDGKFNISIGDWTLNTDNKYTVKVEPADVDKGTYDSYSSEEKTVTEDQVKTKKIELGTITLKEKSVPYSVTANAETSDHSEKDDAGEVKVENNVVTATPKEGYEITAVTVKKETADWKPDGETNDNWWNKNINASGAFVYEEFKDKTLDANYAFTVTFAKKQFTITYKISQNGKLILNSDAQNDKVEITTESGEDGSRNVPYTDSEYKIKAAVTDNKYHLTSFRVDNDERLNENEINNSLKEKEYIFSEGIKQAHSIEVTAEIDTYTVSVTTDDGGIVEVNGSSEKNIIVDSGAEVAIIVKPNEGKTVKIFSCLVLSSLFTSVNAQLRVLSDGRVQMGQNVPSLDPEKVATLLVLGSNDKIGTGAIIALGDFGPKSKNTFWGEYGNTDSDQLWFQGKLGYYLTYGEQANSVVSYYDPAKNSNFVFNTNLRVNGVNITSDARMKDNIQPIENPIDILSRVDGVSYTYRLSEIQKNRKSEENAFPETPETMTNEVNDALTEKEQRDEQIKKEIELREEEEANRRRIGFMAQDIQKVLPELVQTDEKGVMSIDYIGFIPLIVESLKQMQQTIQDQQKEIETLQSLLPAETKSMFRSTSNEDVSVVEGAKLYNRAGASVSYTLPATYNTADLKVFDISGKLLKKIILTGNNSIVDFNSSEIGYGTFIYMLFVDGKKADTLKKFIN